MTIPDASLASLMASPALLAQMWPSGSHEVMMLVHLLRMAGPSLAEVLALGLVRLLMPPAAATSSQIWLAHKVALVSANARTGTGDQIAAPHTRPADVVWLEMTDVAVAGRSGLRMAG